MTAVQVEEGIVDRLFSSFIDLEKAIDSARKSLEKSSSAVPAEVFERLDSYGGIINRQRQLTEELAGYVRNGDLDEVMRHVTLINGLSGMIIDDAHAILASIQEEEITFDRPEDFNDGEDDFHFC